MISFIEYIVEKLNIIDNKLVFNDSDGIPISFGIGKTFKPFKKTIEQSDIISYSLYKEQNFTNILKALKSTDFNDPNVSQFLNRSAIYAVKILRELHDVNIIVSPVSSSNLTKEFGKRIQLRTNYDFFIDSFRKTIDISNITVNKLDPRITQTIINSLEKIIQRAKNNGFISVKQFLPQHRKFIQNLFELIDLRLINKVEDKHVVILDDVMTSGTTANQIANILKTHGAKKISILTLFKAGN